MVYAGADGVDVLDGRVGLIVEQRTNPGSVEVCVTSFVLPPLGWEALSGMVIAPRRGCEEAQNVPPNADVSVRVGHGDHRDDRDSESRISTQCSPEPVIHNRFGGCSRTQMATRIRVQ